MRDTSARTAARPLSKRSSGFSVVVFNVSSLRKMGYNNQAIQRLFNWQRKVSPNLSPHEHKEIREKLINAGASPKVVRNVEKIYEG